MRRRWQSRRRTGGDERGEAVVLGQLGTLALLQGDLTEARRRYLEALEFDRRVGDRAQNEAIGWHQLGMVAQEARDWEEAERCYRESLAIKERIGDKALAATHLQPTGHRREGRRPAGRGRALVPAGD